MTFFAVPFGSLDWSTTCSHTWELSKAREVVGARACPVRPHSPSLEWTAI